MVTTKKVTRATLTKTSPSKSSSAKTRAPKKALAKAAPAKTKATTKKAPAQATPASNEALTSKKAQATADAPKRHRVFGYAFSSVYPLYVQKVEKKGRTRAELDEVIAWLTGYKGHALAQVLEDRRDLETFFAKAPRMNPKMSLIQGVVCGVRIEEVSDPLMRKIRYLDKLVDELAQGRAMEKILRL